MVVEQVLEESTQKSVLKRMTAKDHLVMAMNIKVYKSTGKQSRLIQA